LEREASILRELNKANIPNIVKVIEYIENKELSLKKPLFQELESPEEHRSYRYKAALVMELASSHTFFDFVFAHTGLEEKLTRTYFKELISTVSALHQNGYCHRDLKLENLLLDETYNIKLCDFGFADQFTQDTLETMTAKLGTEYYMAPELHYSKPYSGIKVDMFACGILLFLMMIGRPPFFRAIHKDPFYRHIITGNPEKFWLLYEEKMNGGNEYDPTFKQLFNALVSANPEERPDASSLSEFEWMRRETYSCEQTIEIMKVKKETLGPKKKQHPA